MAVRMGSYGAVGSNQIVPSGSGIPVFVRRAINMSLSPLVDTSRSPSLLDRANTAAIRARKVYEWRLEPFLALIIVVLCFVYSLACVEAAAARNAVGPSHTLRRPGRKPGASLYTRKRLPLSPLADVACHVADTRS